MSRTPNCVKVSGALGCLVIAPIILIQMFLAIAIPCTVLAALVAAVYYLCTGEFILQ
jgi:hypothetical protein